MLRHYHVYVVDASGYKVKHVDLVTAISASSAEHTCYLRYGNSSRYSGWSRENFVAEPA